MAVDSLVRQLATASLTKEQQLALITQLESNIKAKQEQEDTLGQAAKVIAGRIKKLEGFVKDSVKEMESIAKVPGPRGSDGKDGKQGLQGPKGLDGKNGRDGVDGQDGQDGEDGKSIVDVYFAADGNLVCVLSDGTEIDAGIPLGAFGSGKGDTLISNWAGYSTAEIAEELKDVFIKKTFETVNKNLEALDAILTYDSNDDLITVEYSNGVVKTLSYNSDGDLVTVVLSSATPLDIMLTKTLGYDASGNLVSVTYT
jgi:hypothetical protein